MGGNGGCGEFDILEAIIGNKHSDMLFTTARPIRLPAFETPPFFFFLLSILAWTMCPCDHSRF